METTPGHDSVRPDQRRLIILILPALIALAAFVVFLPALQDGFVYDDHADIRQVDNVFIPGAWPKLLYTASAQLYRPVKYLSYYVDNVLWSWKPMGWHLQSLLWHALNSVLAFFLIRRLKVSDTAAALGALWFAIHPIHAEAVVWISSRASLLSTAAVLACLIAYIDWRETGRRGALCWLVGCGVFGFFSKEDALMLFPILGAYELWFRPAGNLKIFFTRPVLMPLVLLGIAAIIYVLLRQSTLVGLKQGQGPAGLPGLLTTLPVILVTYLGQLIYPTTLSVDQPVDYGAGFGPAFFASTLVLLLLAALFLVRGERWAKWKFCVAWFFFFLVPVMGFIPINQPRADRFLYLPSLAAAIFLAFGWDTFRRWKPAALKPAAIAFAAWSVCFAAYSFEYSKVWLNEQTLWEHTVKVNPDSYRGYANLAAVANNSGAPQKALVLVDLALAIKPEYPEGFVIKAFALDALGKPAEAEKMYRQALSRDPNNTLWLFLLASHLELTGALAEAEKLYDRITELRPSYVDARLSAGVLAARLNKREQAIAHWQAVLEFDPGNEGARSNLALILGKPPPPTAPR